mmetsp:Transcript_3747/g.7255  ORF Transcript_3747/g.7255 Transcript_3747/m.7255 type:complete len:338 (+) Transcript_3747:124-1137(+)
MSDMVGCDGKEHSEVKQDEHFDSNSVSTAGTETSSTPCAKLQRSPERVQSKVSGNNIQTNVADQPHFQVTTADRNTVMVAPSNLNNLNPKATEFCPLNSNDSQQQAHSCAAFQGPHISPYMKAGSGVGRTLLETQIGQGGNTESCVLHRSQSPLHPPNLRRQQPLFSNVLEQSLQERNLAGYTSCNRRQPSHPMYTTPHHTHSIPATVNGGSPGYGNAAMIGQWPYLASDGSPVAHYQFNYGVSYPPGISTYPPLTGWEGTQHPHLHQQDALPLGVQRQGPAAFQPGMLHGYDDHHRSYFGNPMNSVYGSGHDFRLTVQGKRDQLLPSPQQAPYVAC